MKLIDCDTLVNIEGEVFRLTSKNYAWFKNQIYKHRASDNLLDWSELLHWVQNHGVKICDVETYNF